MSYNEKLLFARQLRKHSTKAESLLWNHLRNRKLLGYKFRRQHIIEGFILDFYCPELKLGIELDGSIHENEDIHAYDILRSKILCRQGAITILRLPNSRIENNILGARKDLQNHIQEIVSHFFS